MSEMIWKKIFFFLFAALCLSVSINFGVIKSYSNTKINLSVIENTNSGKESFQIPA
jgi:hypothetical protein